MFMSKLREYIFFVVYWGMMLLFNLVFFGVFEKGSRYSDHLGSFLAGSVFGGVSLIFLMAAYDAYVDE